MILFYYQFHSERIKIIPQVVILEGSIKSALRQICTFVITFEFSFIILKLFSDHL